MPDLITRRQAVVAGTLAPLGLGLPTLVGSPGDGPTAKACILLFMWGGPSQIDTWDPKPDAPEEIRGPFRSTATKVPGVRIGEHFPRLAQRTDKLAILRSMSHADVAHLSSVHHLTTGRLAPRPNSDDDPPTRGDHPHMGAMLDRLRPVQRTLPTAVTVPWQVSHPAAPGGMAPGQHAGWLGAGYDPFLVTGDPSAPGFRVGGLSCPADVPALRQTGRDRLLAALDTDGPAEPNFTAARRRATSLLANAAVEAAFDLGKESPATRDQYGRHVHGQSCMLARRLVEAGTRLVTVNWHNDGRNFWDTHGDNFNQLKTRLMPPADQGFAALLDDLGQRGMLDSTLVVWVGEFGRRPQITSNNAGREHWARCYSAVLAGGGVRGGQVIGASDAVAAYPTTDPISPADLTATIYHALGVDPETEVTDKFGRPVPLTAGRPVTAAFG